MKSIKWLFEYRYPMKFICDVWITTVREIDGTWVFEDVPISQQVVIKDVIISPSKRRIVIKMDLFGFDAIHKEYADPDGQVRWTLKQAIMERFEVLLRYLGHPTIEFDIPVLDKTSDIIFKKGRGLAYQLIQSMG